MSSFMARIDPREFKSGGRWDDLRAFTAVAKVEPLNSLDRKRREKVESNDFNEEREREGGASLRRSFVI